MSDPFIGQLTMFGGTFAPRGWAECDGQLLAVSQNDALFSLLGTIYGGDGRTTFGLPDLRGRVPVHMGAGPGLSPRTIGSKGGQETVVLSPTQLPSHDHGPFQASGDGANQTSPVGKTVGVGAPDLYTDENPDVNLSPQAVSNAGSSTAHDNMIPFQAITFIIALAGIFPSRS